MGTATSYRRWGRSLSRKSVTAVEVEGGALNLVGRADTQLRIT